jgi:hypothetical protein
MLVFISDLRLMHRTARQYNLFSPTFEYFYDDLAAFANKPSNKLKGIELD